VCRVGIFTASPDIAKPNSRFIDAIEFFRPIR